MLDWENYKGREQSYVKHLVLQRYLQRLTYKVGLGLRRSKIILTYIDGFSGPWNEQTNDFADTSFQIAMNEFRAVQQELTAHNIKLVLRCLFVEKDLKAFSRLKDHVNNIPDIQFKLINGEFENNIESVCEYAQSDDNMFTFTFIDPTGWSGYALKQIKPLLQLKYSEVLINFMYDYINRFIEDERPDIKTTFNALFGRSTLSDFWSSSKGINREEAIVEEYKTCLKETSGYRYVANTAILVPQKDRTYFHLIYASNSLDGLLTFRQVEQSAMREQNRIRNIAKQQQRETKTGSLELFDANEIGESIYYNELRERFNLKAKQAIQNKLIKKYLLSYDDLLEFLEIPMTYESDIKEWLGEWKNQGLIKIEGLIGKQRVPQKGKGYVIIWNGKL